MDNKNISQINSKYFDFKTITKHKDFLVCQHVGWSGLSIIKFDITHNFI